MGNLPSLLFVHPSGNLLRGPLLFELTAYIALNDRSHGRVLPLSLLTRSGFNFCILRMVMAIQVHVPPQLPADRRWGNSQLPGNLFLAIATITKS